MDKNSLYFPLFVLVHPSPAVVWALVVFFALMENVAQSQTAKR